MLAQNFRLQFFKKIQSKVLNKKMQVNHWSTFLTNQVLPCGEIGLNQLRKAYTSGLIPSKGTSKIAGSISFVNVIGVVS